MSEKMMLPKPEAFALDRQVISGDLDVHIACPGSSEYGEGPPSHIIAIRMVQDMAGKDITDSEWEIIKDDLRCDFAFPTDNYGNGVYEILLKSYKKEGEEIICSEENIYTVTIFRKKTYRSTIIDDCGNQVISAYDHIYGDESASSYVNNVLLNHPMREEKGYLLEAKGWRFGGGLYHKMSLRPVIRGERGSEKYEGILPLDENGMQIAGDKRALFFVPAEREPEPSFEMHFAEYSDPECKSFVREKILQIGMKDFSAWFYLDFSRKNPRLFLTTTKEKADRAHINIRAENFNPDIHCMHLVIEEADEGEILSERIEEAYHKVDLLTPGNYRLKVVLTNLSGRRTFDRAEVAVRVLEPHRLVFCHEKTVRRKEYLDLKLEPPQGKKIKKFCIGISGYETRIDASKEGNAIHAKIKIPESIPCGLHRVFAEVVLEDNILIKASSPVIIKKNNKTFHSK